ncbi:M20 family metallo-hydrolase [Stutzerimonas kirkiae]|uniref:Zn-dependent hydrolase n=1 Tax=Stutzerimonas kirkiae TaxID=2211392 RepID=A0A4Q9RCJ5_9GAMM|nr:M20 family metallo-hydrolase [Stutzerimonas kirkiae]TBU98880.1 Zn-dependent hydrolase [Stutzerimonas kirkiae]TBV03974.1 Zn-dependent hydrolase [Stutzerimonas kirkiae]TBV09615.1 Zn-dependent hydrolase [Stutzerimonas kirkiae]
MSQCLPPSAIDIEGFDQLFAESSRIGATPAGGLHRLAASREDGQVRDLLSQWLEAHDLDVRVDPAGNLFGLATFDPAAPYILCGSHLDSQPTAGRFDGAYGVIAGAVAVARVSRLHRQAGVAPRFNLALVDWTNEEGARFQPSLIGSSYFIGELDAAQAHAATDAKGVTLGQALGEIGYLGAARVELPVAGYAEVHVEQGTGLSERAAAIGVVRSTWAAIKLSLRFNGVQAHTGPTPMAARIDALWAAARCIDATRRLSDEFGSALHSSVGKLDIYPNSPNVVPSRVTCFVELRSARPALLEEACARLHSELDAVASATGCGYQVLSEQVRAPAHLEPALGDAVQAICHELALPCVDSVTVSGHDAISMSRKYPSVLVFIPSEGGIAHNEGELTQERDLHNGLHVLTEFLYRASIGRLAL